MVLGILVVLMVLSLIGILVTVLLLGFVQKRGDCILILWGRWGSPWFKYLGLYNATLHAVPVDAQTGNLNHWLITQADSCLRRRKVPRII